MNDQADFTLPGDLPASLHAEIRGLGERFLEAMIAAGAPRPPMADVLGVFAASPFVAEIAIRRPVDFIASITSGDIERPRVRDDYAALISTALTSCTDIASVQSALRRLRQIELARIAWRDIHLGVDVVDSMAELSAFADAVIGAACAWLVEHAAPRFGRALGADGDALALVVIAMGKLGGNELNFSSDIDLIFVYGAPGTTVGGRKPVSHQDYFDRIGREFIALVSEITADGFVFRVDMRLRPFGDSGTLTTSLQGLEHYYAVHGRDWERYALIKARAVTGDDATVAALGEITRPFVYRRYLDFGALDALREMKQLIDREARSADFAGDIKRGPGGIREIEFTGQLFQLTRGGREPRLRQQSLLAVLEACVDLGLLTAQDVATLLGSYRFLRVTEHRLQQVRDWQTHALPDDHTERERLAYALGFDSWSAFTAELGRHRDGTRKLFTALLEVPEPAGQSEDNSPWREIWLGPTDSVALRDVAAAAGVTLSTMQLEDVVELKSERFLHRLSREGRARIDRLMPALLECAARQGLSEIGFRRIKNLVHAIARRSVYMAFLNDNPDALKRLIELFDASPWIADQMIAQPLLLDELLDSRTLFAPPDAERLRELVANQVRVQDGLEQAMENLRAFRNQHVLRVAASDVTEHLPVARVSDQLTYIAEACIEAALALALAELVLRFGEPQCDDGNGRRGAGFAIVGYGKLGGWELGYGSDLDLVFLHDSAGVDQHTGGARSIENEVFFTRLTQRFIHILGTTTPSGVAYEIDTRLRPSGSAGMMVSSTSAFMDYLNDDAWVWEHQALVRARGVAGDQRVLDGFADIRRQVLARPRNGPELRREIAAMRERMLGERDRSNAATFDVKHGAGGVTDIEFMVQYAVLRWACTYPSLLTWTDNLRLLETIAALELLPADACRCLHDAYFAYRANIHRCALQQIESVVDATKFSDHRRRVIEVWEAMFESEFVQE